MIRTTLWINRREERDAAMYNHQLDTFIVVAETGSFARAAATLFISSSAVIQQINNLERDLKVTLFSRGRKGVSLTEAGTYLLGQAREAVARNELLRKKILEIANKDKVICIGTSMIEKCRLLYELWVLFTMENSAYEIRMISIEDKQKGMQEAELIESIGSGAAWQRDLDFLKLTTIPYGFAVAKDHPMAGKKQFTPKEMKGQTVAVICQGKADPVSRACAELEEAGAEVLYYGSFNDSDLLLTRRISGEDCADLKYLSEPKRLCDTTAMLLRALHEIEGSDCPVESDPCLDPDRLFRNRDRQRTAALSGHQKADAGRCWG